MLRSGRDFAIDESTPCASGIARVLKSGRRALGAPALAGTGALTLLTVMMGSAHADDGEAAAGGPAELSEVIVTGSRIARDGFEAPTPLTIVGVEQMQQQATPNLIDYITTLPSFAGNYTPQNSTQNVSAGTAGTSSINLRNLGTTRTLVLIDGQRSVASTITGLVDINTIPSQLIERVEVVTGGASAAYGSDAVSGVVNFILDKKFTGFKADAGGGLTDYGDNKNGKFSVTIGSGFAGDRGHIILSGEHKQQDGVLTGDREWNNRGWQIVNNPAYTATNGQPSRLLLDRVSAVNATPGGIINTGALRGVAFGPGGTPYTFNYGPLISGSAMQGGDWQTSSLHLVGQSIEPANRSDNVFLRASFDVTDNLEVYVQSNWYENSNQSHAYPNEYFGGLNVSATNPFLPASIAARVAQLGLTTLSMGTSNADMGTVTIDTGRKLLRNVVGVNGDFEAFGKSFSWDAYYQNGVSKSSEAAFNSLNLNNFALALDSVVNPATGAIVCRSTLTSPNNGCIPYNPFGTGVNSQAALSYVLGRPHRAQKFEENNAAVNLRGSPFDDWAGPVSFATGVEYRKEEASGNSTALDKQRVYFAGNYIPTFGSYDVTEGYVETVVPLAKDLPFAKSLEFNGAVRFTDYSTSGSVTTWKAGATWRPFDDLMFRGVRSRDIRAPNLSELYNAGSRVNNQVVDNSKLPVVSYQYEGTTSGNPNLDPEEADSTDFGVVYQPSWAPGLSASVDYWDIDLKDAISTVSAQQIVDACLVKGNTTLCQAINNGGPLQTFADPAQRNHIDLVPFNLAKMQVRGVDIETSYRLPLSNLFSDLNGTVAFRALATHFLKNYTDNTLTPPTDNVGQNTSGGSPDWRWNASISYGNDPFSATFSARGVSNGVYGSNFIECTAGCPTSSTDYPTINNNHIAGATFFDLSLSYTFLVGKEDAGTLQTYVNIRNLANKDPVIVAGGPSGLPFDTVTTNPSNYDSLGRVYFAGVRVKL
jgi:outer membrane receptor protein involved in Fe transport